MSLRFLLGALAPAQQRQINQTADETDSLTENEVKDFDVIIVDFESPAKFHIGMLTLSLIAGLAFGGLVAYNCWMEKNIFLGYIRNLVIALTCRTFFSIIFDGAILLGSPLNVGGGNTLLSFEQICLNLVLAFWLTLTIYLHARVQRNFNSEPSLMLYQYGVPGVGVFFVFVWIFTLQDQWPSRVWWIFINPISQWIVNSINFLYILIQLALVVDIGRMMKKTSLDNDSLSLLRKVAIMMGVLVLIFWFQFGFTIGRVPLKNPSSYVYFFYFIDGLECALVCLTLYFFNKWVLMLINKVSSTMIGLEEPGRRMSKPEKLLTGNQDRGIVTIDSVFMTNESAKWNNLEKEGAKDVVYSSVLGPERLQKTLQLYKRLNIIPTNQVTVVNGEKFYDCKFQGRAEDSEKINLSPNQIKTLVSDVSKQNFLNEDNKFKSDKVCERTQKKNAFYSSKYLILDSKETDIPKYLETRPSVSLKSDRGSLKEEGINENLSSTLNPYMSDELVRKWLHENSENMQKKKETTDKNKRRGSNFERKTLKHSMLETSGNTSKENNDQNSKSRIVSTINSVVTGVFRSSKNEKKRLSQDNHSILKKDQYDSVPSPNSSELNLQEKQATKNEEPPIPTGLSEQKDELQYENETKKPTKTLKNEAAEVLEAKNDTENTPKSLEPETLNSEQTRATEEKIMDGTVDAVVSDAKEDIEKPLNQYLTYAELMEFRSQQAKLNPDQPPEGNNFFSWSETISSTIGSLINASSTFFNGKHLNGIDSENNEIQNFYPQAFNDNTKEEINSESEKNTNMDLTLEQIQSQTNKPKAAPRNQIHKPTEDGTTPDSTTVLEIPQEDTNKTNSSILEQSTPNLQEGSSNISANDQTEISEEEFKSKNTSNHYNDDNTNLEEQHNEVAVGENLPTDTKNHKILDEEQNEISELELQNKKHDISKNELILKSKNEDSSSKHRLAHKADKQRILKKSKKPPPQSSESLGGKEAELQLELGEVLPKERTSDTSSEFNVESPNEVSNLLSQQQYSETPMDMEKTFTDDVVPLQDIHNFKNKS